MKSQVRRVRVDYRPCPCGCSRLLAPTRVPAAEIALTVRTWSTALAVVIPAEAKVGDTLADRLLDAAHAGRDTEPNTAPLLEQARDWLPAAKDVLFDNWRAFTAAPFPGKAR